MLSQNNLSRFLQHQSLVLVKYRYIFNMSGLTETLFHLNWRRLGGLKSRSNFKQIGTRIDPYLGSDLQFNRSNNLKKNITNFTQGRPT